MRQNDLRPAETRPRGLLRERVSFEHFELTRFEPSADLAPFVENYWMILHDLGRRPPYTQQNLSHPSLNMVVNPQGETGIFGVVTGVFSYTLKGTGRIFGTKFWPGAFRAFNRSPVGDLADRMAAVETVFDRRSDELAEEFRQLNDPLGMAERIEDMLRRRKPVLDAKAKLAREIVAFIDTSTELFAVPDLASAFATTVRSLQRLFAGYVGVSPKWVIDRYRMIEAVDALNRGEAVSLTALAHRLGYFDQAHFTHAFEALTGKPPSAFLAANG